MSQIFTPKRPSRPAHSISPKPSSAATSPSSSLAPWRSHLQLFVRWTIRHVRSLTVIITRYVRALNRKQRYRHGLIILAVVVFVASYNLILSRSHSAQIHTPQVGSGVQLPKESPAFMTILPKGKSATDYGGWTRVSPSDRTPSYAYVDTLSGVIIRVNEQQIPDNFKSDLNGSVEKLADDFGATHTLDAGETKIYIGKNSKGPQSLIFIKHDLLISITSNATIPDDVWIAYVKSLQ